nr:DUF4430 domain-containing protein [Tissierella sp.]
MNLRNNTIKRLVSFLFAFALIISFVAPSVSFAEGKQESKYSVKVRIEGRDSTFVKPMLVNFDSLEMDGYPRIAKPEGGFKSLKPVHALMKALDKAGIDPNDESKLSILYDGTYIGMINGLEGNWMYTVDNKSADLGMNEFDIKNGQEVVMYYQENWEDSYYTWFEKEAIQVKKDEIFDLKLNASSFGKEDTVMQDAVILVNDKEYKQDGKLVKTNAQGLASLSFKEEGTYHISASKKNAKGEQTLSRAYASVEVKGAVEVKEASIKSIEAVKNIKVEFGTKEDRALSLLPKTTNIIDSNGKKHSVNLKWNLNSYLGEQPAEYIAKAIFTLPEGVKQSSPEMELKLTAGILVLEEKEVVVINKDLDKAIKATSDYYKRDNPGNPTGEWEAYIGLWASGNALTREYDWEVVDPGLKADTSGNETLTYAYSLLAQGKDPSNIWGGRNLFAELAGQQRDNGVFTNIGKHVFSIVLLDAGEKMGADVGSWNAPNRQKAIDELLKMQNEDGSFASFSYLDHTAMSLIALAEYRDQAEVNTAINKALAFLKSKQTENGGFDYKAGNEKGENSNSISLIIQGLVAVGEDITNHKGAWAKDGKTPLDALMKYKQKDGSFLWKLDTSIKGPATKQALVALTDIKNGKSSWLRLGEEIYLSSVGEEDVKDLIAEINKLPAIEKINFDNKTEVMGAYNRYIKLPPEYKLKVTNSAALLKAQEKISKIELTIKEIDDGIWDLPGKTSDITLKHKDKVAALLVKYNSLSKNDKKHVKYYNELQAAKAQIDKLEKEQGGSTATPGTSTPGGNNGSDTGSNSGSNTGSNSGSNNSQNSPKTGDNGILMPMILLLISGAVIVLLSKKRKTI